jgi:hypothetical protein
MGPIEPLIQWVQGAITPKVKRLGREANHPPPSSAHVKNGGAISPLIHTSSWYGQLYLFFYLYTRGYNEWTLHTAGTGFPAIRFPLASKSDAASPVREGRAEGKCRNITIA